MLFYTEFIDQKILQKQIYYLLYLYLFQYKILQNLYYIF